MRTLLDECIPTDRRLSHEQTVSKFAIAVVVLVARRNKLEFLLPLVPELLRVLAIAKPGQLHRVDV